MGQAKTQVSMYSHADISQWKTDMIAWLDNMSDALTTTTTRLPRLTEHSLVTHSVSAEDQVTSAKHERNFTVKQLEDVSFGVSVLSVSNESQLLVGRSEDRQLHVYSDEGNHLTSFSLLDDDTLEDAVWTPRGNIAYTTYNRNNVVTMTQRGEVVAQTETSCPHRLNVSTDEVIYLADYATGVYQSTDDGVTWRHVFNVAYGWQCVQVIKVSGNSNTQVFWTIERSSANNSKWRLQIYTVDKRRIGNGSNITSRDVTLPSRVAINLRSSKLVYDDHTSLFVIDTINSSLHVWSVSGQYVCQLVQSQQLVSTPVSVAVDRQRGHVLMYVGQYGGTVGVFEIK